MNWRTLNGDLIEVPLIEKVEELTLYLIQLKKENEEIKAKLADLTNK